MPPSYEIDFFCGSCGRALYPEFDVGTREEQYLAEHFFTTVNEALFQGTQFRGKPPEQHNEPLPPRVEKMMNWWR
jgi:hypothetical protein